MPKCPTKNALFGYFQAGILEKFFHIRNQHHWVDLISKYYELMKMLKFGTKSTLFVYFWTRILKNSSHI